MGGMVFSHLGWNFGNNLEFQSHSLRTSLLTVITNLKLLIGKILTFGFVFTRH